MSKRVVIAHLPWEGKDYLVHTLVEGEKPVELTAKEFDLLWFFMRHPRQVFSREQLLDNVWGFSEYIDASTVTVHIHRLRDKVEVDPAKPKCLVTVWGVGYRLTGD